MSRGVSLAWLLLLLTLALVLALLIHQNNDAAAQREQIVNLQRTIEDCTVPGGECYQRGQERTGDAIGQIVRAITAQSLCADHESARIRVQCIERLLTH